MTRTPFLYPLLCRNRREQIAGRRRMFCRRLVGSFYLCFTVSLCLASLANGATQNAASVSYSDVAAAVASAASGDTVIVPSGNATWNQTLNVGAKAVSIVGAGPDNTVITNNVGTLFEFARTGSSFARLSGFKFISSYSHKGVVSMVGPISKIRIDNCYFEKADTGIITNYVGKNASGPVYGVVDHCTFHNMGGHGAYFAMDIRGNESSSGPHWGETAWQEWQSSPAAGTDRMLYFEDCSFLYDSGLAACSQPDATIYGQYGGKVCIRNSVFSGYAYTYIDAHGDNPEFSTLYYELYNNNFSAGSFTGALHATSGNFTNQRGGKRIMHDNTFSGGKTPDEMMVYWNTDVRIVSDTFIWGNTRDGSRDQSRMLAVVDSGQAAAGFSASHILLNKNYFLRAPQPGDSLYPYSPLDYPHPLVQSSQGTLPPPPTTPTPAPSASPSASPSPVPPGVVSLNASDAVLTLPFALNSDNTISQSLETDDLSQAGEATYTFVIDTPGAYVAAATVNCPDAGSNSFFINIDAEPTADMVWAVPLTTGPEIRAVTFSPNITSQVWNLSAGSHTLFVRGREANARLGSIVIGPALPALTLRVDQ